jgi:hypothetical protein
MPTPPPCTGLGPQCRALAVTLHIADLEEDTPTEQDAAGTWLLGHTERIAFGRPYVAFGRLVVDAVVHVPCKHLSEESHGNGSAPRVRCSAHGFVGPLVRRPVPDAPPVRHGSDRFTLVERHRVRTVTAPAKRSSRRTLPTLQPANPCATASCRTADNRHGAACCRDLTLDVLNAEGDGDLEALLRARKSPYLCKVKRTDPTLIECEVISACGYLDVDGVSCVLHGRLRPNGRPAKPGICSEWPDFERDDDFTGHPGCVFL